jgi:hypothetical protein
MHLYRSFGVDIPSSQPQMGPVVTFLIWPSVHTEVQTGQKKVTPSHVTDPRWLGQLWFTALQVLPLHETLGDDPHKAVHIALAAKPLAKLACSTGAGSPGHRAGTEGAAKVLVARKRTPNSAFMTTPPWGSRCRRGTGKHPQMFKAEFLILQVSHT